MRPEQNCIISEVGFCDYGTRAYKILYFICDRLDCSSNFKVFRENVIWALDVWKDLLPT